MPGAGGGCQDEGLNRIEFFFAEREKIRSPAGESADGFFTFSEKGFCDG
jgi:hypothetical protein